MRNANCKQKPMRSTLPQIRFLQTDSDKSSPAHELPSSGTDKVGHDSENSGKAGGSRANKTRWKCGAASSRSMMEEIPVFRSTLLMIQFRVNLPEESFHSYRCDAPGLEVEVSKDELVNMYKTMVRLT